MTRIQLELEEHGSTVRVRATTNGVEQRTMTVPSSALESEVLPLVRALVRGRRSVPEAEPETPAAGRRAPTIAFRCRGTRHLRLGVRPFGKATVAPGKREPCPGCPDCESDEFGEVATHVQVVVGAPQVTGQQVDQVAKKLSQLLDRVRFAHMAIHELEGLLESTGASPRVTSPGDAIRRALHAVEADGLLREPTRVSSLFDELARRGASCETLGLSKGAYYNRVSVDLDSVFGARVRRSGKTAARRVWVVS